MSVDLAKMLGRPEAQVAKFIEQMEDKFGYPSHDVRLLAEVNQAVKGKIAALGLDPHDTTAEELYHGLQARFATDAAQMDKALGAGPATGYERRLGRAVELAQHIVGDAEVWTLKPTVARNLLLSLPPKKLMKQLRYRSLESMLKHENVGELYLLAPHMESTTWQNALAKAAARLPSNNYALCPINFVRPQAARWSGLSQPPDLNICDKLTGSVSLYPTKTLTAAPLITLTLMLLQSVQQLGINVDKEALATMHPALQWWANIEHLVSAQRVSFNVNDVAHNHLHSADHENSGTHHGSKALWDELTDRYQSLASEADQAVETSVEKLIPAALAAEFQEA